MAAASRIESSAACPFDRLSDEVLCEVLRRAAASDDASLSMEPEGGEEWVSGCKMFHLTRVCQRFRDLQERVANHVTWSFPRQADTRVVNAVLQAGPHTRGVALIYACHYVPVDHGRPVRVVSLDFLAALFGRTPNLNRLILVGSGETQEGTSSLFYRLLSQLPLEELLLSCCDFNLSMPLSHTQHFLALKKVKIVSTQISDELLSSLLEQAPRLKTLAFELVRGLVQPIFCSPSLTELVVNLLHWDVGHMTIDTPNLRRLQALPPCERLTIHAPSLDWLSVEGPMQAIECLHRRSEVAHLELSWGSGDWLLSDVVGLIGTLRGSASIEIRIGGWDLASQPEPLSTFLKQIPLTIQSLSLGSTAQQLFKAASCEIELKDLSFEQLTQLQISVTQAKDMDLLPLILRCCPKLERVNINFLFLTTPIDGLLTRICKLQWDFPQAQLQFKEPAQFVSSLLLENIVDGDPEQFEEFMENIRTSN